MNMRKSLRMLSFVWVLAISLYCVPPRMLRLVTGIKRIAKNRTQYIRARAVVGNIRKKVREARPRLLGHVERPRDEDVVMRTWKMGVSGHRNGMTETDVERCYTKI